MSTRGDWLADRNELERRWGRWRTSLAHRGLRLTAGIPLETNWVGIEKRFPIAFHDRSGGSFDVLVRRQLLRLTANEVIRWVRKSLRGLPVGDCARCGRRSLLQEYQRRRQLCRRCVLRSIDEESREETRRQRVLWQARAKDHRAKGFRYVLEVWIHPQRGGDDFFIEVPFKTRPTPAAARRIARARRSALLDDFRIIRL